MWFSITSGLFVLSVSDDTKLSLGTERLWKSKPTVEPSTGCFLPLPLPGSDCKQERKLEEMMSPSCCIDSLPALKTMCICTCVCVECVYSSFVFMRNVSLYFNLFNCAMRTYRPHKNRKSLVIGELFAPTYHEPRQRWQVLFPVCESVCVILEKTV